MAYFFVNSFAHSVVHRRCAETGLGKSHACCISTAAILSAQVFPFQNNGLKSVGWLAHSLLHRICAKGPELFRARGKRAHTCASNTVKQLERPAWGPMLRIYARKEKCLKSTALALPGGLAHNLIHKNCEETHRNRDQAKFCPVLNF